MSYLMIDQKNSKPPIEEYELHWTKKLLWEAVYTVAAALVICGLIFALVFVGSSEPPENMSDYAKQKEEQLLNSED